MRRVFQILVLATIFFVVWVTSAYAGVWGTASNEEGGGRNITILSANN